jgi:hypothetical protein
LIAQIRSELQDAHRATFEQNDLAIVRGFRVADLEQRSAGLEETLQHYADQFCEGWCKDNGGQFEDCAGCRARTAIETVRAF